MDAFLSKYQQKIKQAIKGVDRYDRDLRALSTWWEKIALIGKINSLEVASTILEDMDSALGQFHQLQEKLIESLIKEHVRKVIVHDQTRCQMAIDVLIRNLFERTADIGFLATDHDVVNFLKNNHKSQQDRLFLTQRLQAYVDIYSVYRDAMLLTPEGELVFQLSQSTRTGNMQDALIQQAVNHPEQYVEYFGETQLMGGSHPNLLYANAVMDEGRVVGVIVLCFRFRNELEGIVDHLLSDQEGNQFLLLNGAGNVLLAPFVGSQTFPNTLPLVFMPEILKVNDEDMMQVCTKGQPYQGYAGPSNWHMCSLLPIAGIEKGTGAEKGVERSAHNEAQSVPQRPPLKDISGLISDDLFDIRQRSMLINDDLELIVLNGIITAARKNAVEFMPVLEAIKNIGRDIDRVFADSIDSLFSTIISGQLNAIRLQASLAVDIMDRNLYERANDCRWWGLSSLLQAALSSPQVDRQSIEQTLAKIHSLYTVYHTLYVYDQQGCYVAFSDDKYQHKIGQKIAEHSAGQDVFSLEDIYQYTVSPFVPFDCYQGEPTYIYNAAIREVNQSGNIVGGIGIVFDSSVQFKAILEDVLPRENGLVKADCYALFTSEQGRILSSSSSEYVIGDTFDPKIDMAQLHAEGSTADLIHLGECVYLLGAAKSQGYREYKRDDGYDNRVIAWVLIAC